MISFILVISLCLVLFIYLSMVVFWKDLIKPVLWDLVLSIYSNGLGINKHCNGENVTPETTTLNKIRKEIVVEYF